MFMHDWAETQLEGLKEEFCITDEDLVGVEILLAYYDNDHDTLTGLAYVLFKRDGLLWEVHASHCSCYGLVELWEPEETTIDAIEFRFIREPWYTRPWDDELKIVLKALKEE